MDVKVLSIFARVAALQNLSAVAAELGLSTGTISKRIQVLENELGTRLFIITTRSIRITEEGAKFLPHAQRVLAELEAARSAMGASMERPAGRLKISAPACLSRRLVTPALVNFGRAYPDIEVHVDITDRIVNLQEEGYDAAIRVGKLTDSALIAKRLAGDRVVVVAAPSYLAQNGAPRRPADLASHKCLLLGDSRTWVFARGRDEISVRVAGHLQSDHGDLLRRAAREGAGLVRTSLLAVEDDLSSGRLVRVLREYEVSGGSAVSIVHMNTKHVAPRLRAFIDHLVDHCRTPNGDAGSGSEAA